MAKTPLKEPPKVSPRTPSRTLLFQNGTGTSSPTSLWDFLQSSDLPAVSTPGGATTQVQFNNVGAFAGDAGLTYTVGTATLTATNLAGSGTAITALNASNLASGTVNTARLGSGTASTSTFLRGDGTWQPVSINGVPFGTMATQNASAVAIVGGTITGMPSPINGSDVVNKTYVDSIVSGASLPSGTPGQILIMHDTTSAFSSILEVYTATSPNATGVNSFVQIGSKASGTYASALSHGIATNDGAHADSNGFAYGITSHGDTFGVAWRDTSHAQTGSTTYGLYASGEGANSIGAGDNAHAEGNNCWAGPFPWPCTLATVSGVTVATITGLAAASMFVSLDTVCIYSIIGSTGNNVVFGAINTVTTVGGNTIVTLTATVTDGTSAGGIFVPGRGANSSAGGKFAMADLPAKWARGDGSFAVSPAKMGDSQASIVVCSGKEASPTAVELRIGGCAGDTARILVRAGLIYGFTAHIVGRTAAGDKAGYFIRQGLIGNISGTTALFGAIHTLGTDINTFAGTVVITADNTNAALSIVCDPPVVDGTVIHWTCRLDLVEVG